MPADLRIAVFGSRAFFKVHPLEDSVLPILLLDGKGSRLYLSFTLKSSILGFLLLRFRGIVCKEIELDGTAVLLRGIDFRQDMVGHNVHTTDK